MKELKNTGLFLLVFMFIIVLGTTLLFFIKIPITKFHLIGFFLLTSLMYCFYKHRSSSLTDLFKTIFLSLIIVIFSVVISTFMFDRSSDGNTYHKDAIGVLKEEFNPVYESSNDFIKKRNDDSKKLTNYSIWTDHYAKANWIIAANFYSLTDNIEAGKAMNIISLYITFSLIASFLVEKLSIRKSIILALIVVFNPVVASQFFTYYNDQLVCLYLFLSIACLIKLDNDITDKQTWFIYILDFVILANMKFNGLGYLLVFSFLFVCRYLYKSYKSKEFFPLFKKLCIIFIPLFIVSLLVVGYPTYIKNTIDHHNPFFPLYDDNGEDIITAQQPKKFLKMNNIEKLFFGTFSKANNLRENDNTDLKIPFTFTKSEITPAMSNDLRISGWGILFSGLLLVSVYVFIRYYKQYKNESWILYTLGVTSLLLVVMSESWWARYTPHFYLFIILAIYVLFKYSKDKWLINIFVVLIIINTLIPFGGNTFYTLKNSININRELKKLTNKEIQVKVNGYNGIIYNLKDYDIEYKLNDKINGSELYYHYLEYQE